MQIVNATLTLYANALRNTLSGAVRTVIPLAVLFAGVMALIAAELLFFQPMGAGMLTGIGRALLQDVFLGTYLSLIGLWVLTGRTVLARHLRVHFGNLFLPILTVVFFFWIARIVVSLVPIPRASLLLVVAAIAINPVPEVLYQDRAEGTGALQVAFAFVSKNWPEWFGAQVPWIGLLLAWQFVFAGGPTVDLTGRLWVETGAELAALHIPATIAWPVSANNAMGVAGAVSLLVGVHLFFLFRGYLYRELSKGNRRLRAWQSRM